ncbi:MAG: bac 5 protein, partial [Chloroflexi bacterium]|nr:bac 5 protein [Chloroflexota bacterium]
VEAIVGYWRAVGVDAQLVEIDGGQLSAGQRNLRFDNHYDIRESSASQFVGLAAHNSSVLGNYIGGQHPEVNDLVKRIQVELAPGPRAELYKQAGNVLYDNHLDIPLFWLPAEAVVDPKVISDYVWPGSISGIWTMPENIKAVR